VVGSFPLYADADVTDDRRSLLYVPDPADLAVALTSPRFWMRLQADRDSTRP